MSSIDRVGAGATPTTMPSVGSDVSGAPTGAPTASFDALEQLNAAESAQSAGSGARFLSLGMTPPKFDAPSSGSGGSDTDSVRNEVAKPFDLSEVSTMFLEFMLTYRKAARLDRQSSLEGQMKQLLGAADNMREAAEKNYNAAIAQAITSFVSAAIQTGVAVAQGTALSKMKNNLGDREASFDSRMKQLDSAENSIAKPAAGPNRLSADIEGGQSVRGSARTSQRSEMELQMDQLEGGSSSAAKGRAGRSSSERLSSEMAERQSTGHQSVNSPPSMEEVYAGKFEASSARSSSRSSSTSNRTSIAESEAGSTSSASKARASVDDDLSQRMFELRQKNQSDRFGMFTAQSQLANSLGQISGSVADGVGKSLVSEGYRKDAAMLQADSQVNEAQAKKAEAAYSAASEEGQNAREAFNKVLDMVAEVERARSETAKSIARI